MKAPPALPTWQAVAMNATDLVATADIAERLGVTPRTVHTWRQRPWVNFPAPTSHMGSAPVWEWETIKKWAELSGRLVSPDEIKELRDYDN